MAALPDNALDLIDLRSELPSMGGDTSTRRWGDERGGVALNFIPMPPDLGCPVDDSAAIQGFYSQAFLETDLGLLEAGATSLDGLPATQVLFKAIMDPQTLQGRIYIASLTLPFRDFSYVIKVQFPELGATGVREALVLDRMFAKQQAEGLAPSQGMPEGWLTGEGPPHLAPNHSEDPAYDADIPEHPLSRVRELRARVEANATVSDSLRSAPPFVFGQAPPPPQRPPSLWRRLFKRRG